MENWNFKAMKFFLIAFFVYIFLEGIIRKWMFPNQAGMFFYAVKYALLGGIYLTYLTLPHSIKSGKVFGIQYAVTIYIFLVIASSITFLGSSNGPILSLFIIAQYCLPLVLIFSIPLYIKSRKQLQRIIKITIILCAIIYILGIIQYNSPKWAFINRYSGETATNEIAVAGGAVRITTVFNYITPTGDFCSWIALFCMVILTSKPSTKKIFITTLILIFSIVCAFMVGSRSVVLIIGTYALFSLIYDTIINHRARFIFLTFVAVVITIAYYQNFGIPAFDTFMDRVNHASYDVDTRISKQFDYESFMDYAGWVGKGAGITSTAIRKLLTNPVDIGYEEEIGRIVIEFGILGFIIITGIRIFFLSKMFQLSFRICDINLRALSFACSFAIIPTTFYIQLSLYNWFSYFCYFTFIGLNYAIYHIDRNEHQQLRRPS